MTLPWARIVEVRRLLEAGHSARAVARMTRVSRETIAKIRRRDPGTRAPPAPTQQRWPDTEADPIRCRTCGALVYPPCHACYVRSVIQRRRRR